MGLYGVYNQIQVREMRIYPDNNFICREEKIL